MKLYFAETMNSYKTCAVARYVGLDVDFRRVDLKKGEQRTPEFLAINPNGKAPALVDGDRSLWESNAIICYLAMKADSDIWPRDERQVEIVKWFNWSADHFSRFAGQLYFENIIRAEFGIGQPDPDAVKEATGYVRRYAGILNDHLADRRYLLDSSKARRELGWFPQIEFDEGFRATVRWYRENPQWWQPLIKRRMH